MTKDKLGGGDWLPEPQFVTDFDKPLVCPQCGAKMTKADGWPSRRYDSRKGGWDGLALAHCDACDVCQRWGVKSPAD